MEKRKGEKEKVAASSLDASFLQREVKREELGDMTQLFGGLNNWDRVHDFRHLGGERFVWKPEE